MTDLDALIGHIHRTVGTDLAAWPGGWTTEIEAALLDAIFSIRARYGKSPTTGVRRVVNTWRAQRGGIADDLIVLSNQNPEELARLLDNHSKIGGRLKTAVVIDAAACLACVGLTHASDFEASSQQRAAYLQVRGCGPVTWSYFGMLLGRSDFKPDTWVMRFVREPIPGITTEQARELLNAAADRLDLDPSELDHAIWNYQRARVRS